MTPDDIPRLEAALCEQLPGDPVKVGITPAGQLKIVVASTKGLLHVTSPPSMDYTALSVEEWLHRAVGVLRSRLFS